MNPSDRDRLVAAGWRECYRHAIYGTPYMVMESQPLPYRGMRFRKSCPSGEVPAGNLEAVGVADRENNDLRKGQQSQT